MAYGIFDNERRVWLGDKAGPRLYPRETMAWYAAGRAIEHFAFGENRLVGKKFEDKCQTDEAEDDTLNWGPSDRVVCYWTML